AEKLDPRDGRWPYLLGRAWRMINADECAAALQRAVAICGNDPPAVRLTLAEVLLENYRLDEAETQLKSLQLADSSDLRCRLDLARLASLRGDSQSCLDQLEVLQNSLAAQTRYRNQGKSLLLLKAETLRRLGRGEEAELARAESEKHGDPSWSDPYFAQVNERQAGLKKYLKNGENFYRQRQYDQSIEVLRQAERIYPDSLWSKILLARALIRTGAPDSNRPDRVQRLEQAVALLEASLRIDPNSVESLFRLAVAKGYQGKHEDAVNLYRRAIELKPDFTMAHFNLAGLLWNQVHDQQGALDAFEGAVRAEPEFVDGHYLYGVVLMQLQRYRDAESHFETVVRLQPKNEKFRAALAECRRRQQN
ncbi:MAG: tetratricopeptide repeat protein, partial [Planctomycetales bacterium]|nr:tetratricopeptide repeat protein [Planctomycetales bacterium]